MRLSQSHFTRAFVNSVGQPPHQWLLERRVDLARHLLSESVLPLADIAIQCGFADQSHSPRVLGQDRIVSRPVAAPSQALAEAGV